VEVPSGQLLAQIEHQADVAAPWTVKPASHTRARAVRKALAASRRACTRSQSYFISRRIGSDAPIPPRRSPRRSPARPGAAAAAPEIGARAPAAPRLSLLLAAMKLLVVSDLHTGRPVEAENVLETNQPTNPSLITVHYPK
jgi:hypothetical protein